MVGQVLWRTGGNHTNALHMVKSGLHACILRQPVRSQDHLECGVRCVPASRKAGDGNSLVAQWLGVCASTAGSMGSIPGRGTGILQAAQPKKRQEKEDPWGTRIYMLGPGFHPNNDPYLPGPLSDRYHGKCPR